MSDEISRRIVAAVVLAAIFAPLAWWMLRWQSSQLDGYPFTPARDARLITKCNLVASLAAMISIAIWVLGVGHAGAIAAIFPLIALCAGLSAVTFGLLGMKRYRRRLMLAHTAWGFGPVAWGIFYLFVLHWRTPV